MWPLIRDGVRGFFTDKKTFESLWDRWVNKARAALIAAGGTVALYNDKIEEAAPVALKGKVKLLALALVVVGAYLRAGDRTPENVKALAAEPKP